MISLNSWNCQGSVAIVSRFRKLELTTVGGTATSDESQKSGSAGMNIQQKGNSWAYYDKMSFLYPSFTQRSKLSAWYHNCMIIVDLT